MADDRGQAYTLEALIAAILLLTAVLFALQSVVITPTSSGAVDRDVQAQLHQQASDALATADEQGELSQMIRYWDCSDGTFADDPNQAGVFVETQGYTNNSVPVSHLGETLNRSFRSGTRYNIQLVYANDSRQNMTRIIQRGSPGDEVVTASYTVTLTDGQAVTNRSIASETLGGCGTPPIPDEHPSSSLYNVVEVRLVLW